MLTLFMCLHMFDKIALVGAAIMALEAFKGFFLGMDPLVLLKISSVICPIPTVAALESI